MKKALILLLVVLVVITGIPVPVAAMSSMSCADCPPGVLSMASFCLLVLPLALVLAAAALVLAVAADRRTCAGRSRAAPVRRPPRLA